jgi:hypothetical protein
MKGARNLCNVESAGRKRFFLFDVPTAETTSALSIVCLKATTAPDWNLPAHKDRKKL